jgi:hypothetical protein
LYELENKKQIRKSKAENLKGTGEFRSRQLEKHLESFSAYHININNAWE